MNLSELIQENRDKWQPTEKAHEAQIFPWGAWHHPTYGRMVFDESFFFSDIIANFNNNVKGKRTPIDSEHVAHCPVPPIFASTVTMMSLSSGMISHAEMGSTRVSHSEILSGAEGKSSLQEYISESKLMLIFVWNQGGRRRRGPLTGAGPLRNPCSPPSINSQNVNSLPLFILL